jgi:hypothetical protein
MFSNPWPVKMSAEKRQNSNILANIRRNIIYHLGFSKNQIVAEQTIIRISHTAVCLGLEKYIIINK